MKQYQQVMDESARKEERLEQQIAAKALAPESAALMICGELVGRSSILLGINRLSQALLGTRYLSALDDVRKFLNKTLGHLESVVTSQIDVPYSEYEEFLDKITGFPVGKRLLLVQQFGLVMDQLADEVGEDPKRRWAMVDIGGRFAVTAKNLLDMRSALPVFLSMDGAEYPAVAAYFRLIKALLRRAVDQYRTRYNVLEHTSDDDIRCAITCLAVLIRICNWTKDMEDMEDMRRNLSLWENQRSGQGQKA
jgi:hypothetical protein